MKKTVFPFILLASLAIHSFAGSDESSQIQAVRPLNVLHYKLESNPSMNYIQAFKHAVNHCVELSPEHQGALLYLLNQCSNNLDPAQKPDTKILMSLAIRALEQCAIPAGATYVKEDIELVLLVLEKKLNRK